MKKSKLVFWILTAVATICLMVPIYTTSVLAADDDIVFTSSLSAEETWIPPEGIVDFIVEVENTGSVDIERFEIITPDAILAAEYGGLAAGESVLIGVPIVFSKVGEYPVELYVVGYNGKDSLTTHTNIIVITVSADPKPTASPIPSLTPEPTEQELTETVEVVEVVETPAQTTPQVVEVSDEKEQDGVTAPLNNRTVLYIVIGVLGAILIVIFIVIMRIILKKKNNGS